MQVRLISQIFDALIVRSKCASKVDFPDLGCSNIKKQRSKYASKVDFPDLGCSNIKKQYASIKLI